VDFGAQVIRIDRPEEFSPNVLARGKESIALNLKHSMAKNVVLKLVKHADVLIEPFRPGVMERLGLGPETLLNCNPRLIYARLTGFGQSREPYSSEVGHDLNYLAISGVLSMIQRQGDVPRFPANLLADFAGGGLLCALGILLALQQRQRTGLGQVIDANMVDGVQYLSTFLRDMDRLGMGTSMLKGDAHFYRVYQTKDNRYVSVAAIEPHFYANLLRLLKLDLASLPDQMDETTWPQMITMFEETFRSRTRNEWEQVFSGSNACVFPVLEPHEVPMFVNRAPRMKAIENSVPKEGRGKEEDFLEVGKHSREILLRYSYSQAEVEELLKLGVVSTVKIFSKL